MAPKPKQTPQSYLNRTAQFERDQKKNPAPSPKSIPPAASGNPYLQARLKVLAKYKAWRQTEIKELEATNKTNNSHYASFVIDILTEVGEAPSEALWNQTRGM